MIFVTGGTGLVGSHVLLQLAQKSKEFRALKRPSSSLGVCKRIFTYYKADNLFKKINWVDGDLTNISSLEDGMHDCDFLLHCAGLVSFFAKDIGLLKKINIEGTANLTNVALSCGIKKAGFVSSIATLGRGSNLEIIDEECYFKPSKNDSNYALSKYFSEQEVWRAAAEGLDVVIINPSVILGPGDWENGSSKIFEKIYNGLKYYTNGSSGYVDVQDVAKSLIDLLFSDVRNERFIVNGANLQYRVCFDKIATAMGRKKATIKVTPFLKEIAWRVEAIKYLLTGKKPLLTKETSNSAMTNRAFSSAKIKKRMGFEFTCIDHTIKKYSSWFIADQN